MFATLSLYRLYNFTFVPDLYYIHLKIHNTHMFVCVCVCGSGFRYIEGTKYPNKDDNIQNSWSIKQFIDHTEI